MSVSPTAEIEPTAFDGRLEDLVAPQSARIGEPLNVDVIGVNQLAEPGNGVIELSTENEHLFTTAAAVAANGSFRVIGQTTPTQPASTLIAAIGTLAIDENNEPIIDTVQDQMTQDLNVGGGLLAGFSRRQQLGLAAVSGTAGGLLISK